GDGNRAHPRAALLHDQPVPGYAALELHEVGLAAPLDGKPQPLGEPVHAGDAHAVQSAGHLVAVLVELATRVQLGHHDLGCAALGIVLVVPLDVRRNAAAVVQHRDGVVGVDGDDDLVAVARQRLVHGVVHHLEDQVVQAGAVGGVADVHAGALPHRLQPLQDLDGGGVVAGQHLDLGNVVAVAIALAIAVATGVAPV